MVAKGPNPYNQKKPFDNAHLDNNDSLCIVNYLKKEQHFEIRAPIVVKSTTLILIEFLQMAGKC
jgi:hypothetical protein